MAAALSLSLISGPDSVRLETRAVDGYEFLLGRGLDVDWTLLDPETNVLSRRHCMFSQEDGDWWLIDLSGNGTFLNHEREAIGDGGRRRLRDGDRIRLGTYEFQVRLTVAEPPRPSYGSDPDGWSPAGSFPVPPRSRDTMDAPIGGAMEPAEPTRPRGPAANPFAAEEDEAPPAPPWSESDAVRPEIGSGNPFSDALDADPWADQPAVSGNDRDHGGTLPPPGAPGGQANPFLDPPELSFSEPAAAAAVEPSLSETPPPAADVGTANPFSEPGDTAEAELSAVPPLPEADQPDPSAVELPDPRVPSTPSSAAPAPRPDMAIPTAASTGQKPSATSAGSSVATPPVADAVLMRALLDGAGLPDAMPRDPEQALHALGGAFRAMITGLRNVQRARRTVRGGFRIAQTSWTENPLKLAVNEDDALVALLGAGRRSAMEPARAVEEVLREIVLHEVATVAAMQEAVRTLLASLAPDKMREAADQGGGLTVLPAQRKARAWDTYEATHARVTAALQDDFDSVFGRAFARAYERVQSEQMP